MLRFLVLFLFSTSALATYRSSRTSRTSGYSSTFGAIPAAIQSHRYLKYLDVPSTNSAPVSPLSISIPPSVALPLNFNVYSRSSPINLQAIHESTPGSYRKTSIVEAPHIRAHTVIRPIVHQVREIISPYRSIRQQVLPLQEDISTIITRGARNRFNDSPRSSSYY